MRFKTLFAGLLLATPAFAQQAPLPLLHPLGYCQETISAAQTLTSAGCTIPANARYTLITVETNAVRWRDDGTAPSATIGWPLGVLVPWGYPGAPQNLQFIPETGSATLNVCFYD